MFRKLPKTNSFQNNSSRFVTVALSSNRSYSNFSSHFKAMIKPTSLLMTFPKADIALSHSGKINSAPTLNGQVFTNSSQLKEVRKQAFISPEREEMSGRNRFPARGQTNSHYLSGEAPRKPKAEQSGAHTLGDSSAVSSSRSTLVARRFAGINIIMSAFETLKNLKISTPQIIIFDTLLLGKDNCIDQNQLFEDLHGPDAMHEYVREQEISIRIPVPESATVGMRTIMGPFAVGAFSVNELYVDPATCTAEFIKYYLEEYLPEHEKIIWENTHDVRKQPVIDFSAAGFKKYVELELSMYAKHMETQNLEVIEVKDHCSQVYNLDEIQKHYENKYHNTLPKTVMVESDITTEDNTKRPKL